MHKGGSFQLEAPILQICALSAQVCFRTFLTIVPRSHWTLLSLLNSNKFFSLNAVFFRPIRKSTDKLSAWVFLSRCTTVVEIVVVCPTLVPRLKL
jgi:hypothetical protein